MGKRVSHCRIIYLCCVYYHFLHLLSQIGNICFKWPYILHYEHGVLCCSWTVSFMLYVLAVWTKVPVWLLRGSSTPNIFPMQNQENMDLAISSFLMLRQISHFYHLFLLQGLFFFWCEQNEHSAVLPFIHSARNRGERRQNFFSLSNRQGRNYQAASAAPWTVVAHVYQVPLMALTVPLQSQIQSLHVV